MGVGPEGVATATWLPAVETADARLAWSQAGVGDPVPASFKMPIWPVDSHEKPVDMVNMGEIPVTRTQSCPQA